MIALPYEVLYRIIKYLKEDDYMKQETLAQCALTCRSWRLPAQTLFFEAIYLSNLHDLHEARRTLKDERDGISLGDVVRKVRFKFRYNPQYSNTVYRGWIYDMLNLMDELFPKLEILDFDPIYFPRPQGVFDLLSSRKFKYLISISTMENNNSYSQLHRTKKAYIDTVKILKERKKQQSFKN